jgi:hypothetical protein
MSAVFQTEEMPRRTVQNSCWEPYWYTAAETITLRYAF